MKVSSHSSGPAENTPASKISMPKGAPSSGANSPATSEELNTPDPSNTHQCILDKRLEEHAKNPHSGRSWDALKSELASKNAF